MANLNERDIRLLFEDCGDVTFELNGTFLFVFCQGLASREQINEISRYDTDLWQQHPVNLTSHWKNELSSYVFNGDLFLFDRETTNCYVQYVSDPPQRTTEESVTETSTKGARDGFTESIQTNLALIRKRLATPTLKVESFAIGLRSQTAINLLYIQDIANKGAVNEARRRLQNIHIDALVTSSQLEEAISDRSYSVIPLIDNTGRPDFAAECLMSGRFVILLDNSSLAIIAPITLTSLINSPEDGYFRAVISSFQRLIRFCGWYLALFLPAFYIALIGFNFEQVPLPLLATIASNRIGLPLSLPFEAITVLVLFELFKEAGQRLPKSVGPTVTVVGGIIVGDAAIRAGITSPTVTVVAATTVIAGYTLVNPTLSGIVSIVRIAIMIISSILGMFGFFMSIFFVVSYLSDLKSFGIPYLSPISPPSWPDLVGAFLKKPAKLMNKRPQNLYLQDDTRMKDDNP
ncbi:spore germination protein [Paenibacillus lignilyticus]|uniref:Spore germination protein n=1 Tax=Paenibacillus lignilyticus TaxID=1172615 RepID=A0ABS5CBF7_9BACL|nr:spore germination protein [Paenibacillus lignilyticus]MBP3963295.1 spore germination protein [Paenibacillus lignilyticus]